MNKCEICKKKPFYPDKKCCFNCTKSNSKCEVWHECGKDCPEWDNAIKTNADRIRAMSDEELAEKLDEWQDWGGGLGKEWWFEWLKQPAEKDGI